VPGEAIVKVRYIKRCDRDDDTGIKFWEVGDINERADSYLLLPYGNVEPADEEAKEEWEKYLELVKKRTPAQKQFHSELRASDRKAEKAREAANSKAAKDDL
jgi:hypothetical protein